MQVNELIALIEKLEETTKPEWGTMTPQRMIEHLVNVFKVSNGKVEVECFSEERKIPVLKKFLMSSRPMPKDYKSPAKKLEPSSYRFESLEEAKKELEKEVEEFYRFFEENPDASPINPTFGSLNKEEWETFHIKHLTHHLTQFSLLRDG